MSDPVDEEKKSNTYDEVPYQSHPFAASHPNVLSTVASFFGLKSPAVDKCRVLEIGCAAGGNLIPMAAELPNSQFVGIDLSTRQITEAQEVIAAIGLTNVECLEKDILDIDADFGEFDYIIVHGVYSWVPPEVATKILQISKQNLTSNGVAYISYNTLPGWHMRGMIRDMMVYHTEQFPDPKVKVNQSRALIKWLSDAAPGENTPYGAYLKQELELLQRVGDYYIYHDHLEEENNPVYFHEFIERAKAQDLQFLGEADISSMSLSAHDLSPEVRQTLHQISPRLEQREQYMDFVRNGMFRRTLLCHKEVELDHTFTSEGIHKLYVTSAAKPATELLDLESMDPQNFVLPDGRTVPVRLPITKAALVCLSEATTQTMRVGELLATANARLGGGTPTSDATALGNAFLSLYAIKIIDLTVNPVVVSPLAGDLPKVSSLVRFQAEKGPLVTTRRHQMVQLQPFERTVARHMDGTKTCDQLLDVVKQAIAKGELETTGTSDSQLAEHLSITLDRFQKVHLLA